MKLNATSMDLDAKNTASSVLTNMIQNELCYPLGSFPISQSESLAKIHPYFAEIKN